MSKARLEGVKVREVVSGDAAAMAEIYNYYVEHTIITFEETRVSVGEMIRRMADVKEHGLPWYVAVLNGTIVGYAYAGPFRTRVAYRFTAESTVYLAHNSVSKGVGSKLLGSLLDKLRELGLHTVVGGVALPNDASVRLQERFGFQKVAHFSRVGFKFDQWIDVGFWQLMLGE